MAQTLRIPDEVLWSVYGVTNEMIQRDPEAAAIIATTPCPKCGQLHGARPCGDAKPSIGRTATIPVAPKAAS